MRVLFLCAGLTQGGIETLLVRKARWMQANGHEATVWALEGGAIEARLRPYADVRIIGKLHGYLGGLTHSFRSYRGRFDVILATGPQTLLLGCRLAEETGARLIVGAYHPAAFCLLPNDHPPFHISIIRELFAATPSQNLVFMNEATKSSHCEYYGVEFSGARILPLAIDDPGLRSIPDVTIKPRKIVSVGRLVDFKPYPLGVIDLIHRLRSNGLDLEYEIYGKGELREDFEAKVRDLGLADVVTLKGEIPYSDLNSVLERAFLFVGMGTSVIEAAVLGIPSLVAPIFDSSGLTSGWLCDQSGYSVGEDPGTRSMEADIRDLYSLDQDQYTESCQRERQGASKFLIESVGPAFINICEAAVPLKRSLSRLEYLRALIYGAAWSLVPRLRESTQQNRTAWSTRKISSRG